MNTTTSPSPTPIHGDVSPAFEGVADAFRNNFQHHNECGASLCITVAGETVVNLWGGYADPAGERPWNEDSMSLVFSCTKAAVALSAHLLIDRGELDLHAPVTRYWPEFGAAGKDHVSVAMMLNHSVGLPGFREPLKDGAYYDWDYMVDRLAAETPFWEPGTRNGYHMMTFGWTVGELVRRVSGQSLGTFFQQQIAGPLGLDFWIGLPESEESRVVPMLPWQPADDEGGLPFTTALLQDPASIPALSLLNSGNHDPNSPAAHRAELGGGGGITNGRGLAGMYTPLANGGESTAGRLISTDAIHRMSAVSMATGHDATLQMPTRFGLGFMRSMDNRHRPTGHMESAVLGTAAFGHAGAGGSLGFADPDCQMAFGYSMNRMGAGILLNARGQQLVDAAYQALGYRTNAPGAWVR